MKTKTAIGLLSFVLVVPGLTFAQEAAAPDVVRQGRRLADLICSNCHVAVPDQRFEPILRPPAPSFDSIANRNNFTADWLANFLNTTHRDISKPDGMPNPELLDYQVKQITAYLLSLQKPAEARTAATSCSREIDRIEALLRQAHAKRQPVASGPESAAARLHRQPTRSSVERAEEKADQNIEVALTSARKLETEGKESDCLATLKKVALQLGE